MSSRLCCEYCGKGYKRRVNLDKHFILCEIVYKAKKKDRKVDKEAEEIDSELPSQKQMYKMLLELALKYNKLEEKVELMNKWVDKKKKKINVLDWLNTPYRYGGDSKKGIDCSRLVIRLTKKTYYDSINGTAASIYNDCSIMEIDQLVEGDLVFFKICKIN